MTRQRYRWIIAGIGLAVLGCLSVAGSSSTSWQDEADQAAAAFDSGEVSAAQERLRRALELAEQQGAPPVERARLLTLLGKTYDSEGESQQAVRSFGRALEVAAEATASDELLLLRAEVLTELGNLYFPLRRPHEGVKALEEALRLRRQVLDPTDPALIESLILLGISYEQTDDLTRAEQLLREAAELAAESPTASGEDKAGPLSSLAVVLERQGRQAEADALREEAMRLLTSDGG